MALRESVRRRLAVLKQLGLDKEEAVEWFLWDHPLVDRRLVKEVAEEVWSAEKVVLSVRVDESLLRELRRLADQSNRTLSDIVREALVLYVRAKGVGDV